MTSETVRGVIFDCFGVLYIDASHAFYENKVVDYSRLRPRLSELNQQSDYGLITQDEWFDQVAEVAGMNVQDVRAGIQEEHVRNQQLIDYSQQLRQRGIRVGMLSNIGTGAMDSFFVPGERATLFDSCVLSGEEMMTKPHPAIFELAAERLGLSPDDCVMVDDLAENCAGADAAGMGSILHRSNVETMRAVDDYLSPSAVG